MRRIILFFTLCFITTFIFAQNIKGGLTLGFNASQVDGDEVFGYHKYGFNTGAFATIPVGHNFSVSIETLFNQKGAYQRPWITDSLSGQYKLILDYLDVPVLLQYTDKDIIKFGAGFSWGRLVTFKEWEHGNRINWINSNGPYKSSDFDIVVDVQFKLFRGFYYDFRYAYSLGKIRTRTFTNVTGTWTRKQYNNLITMRLVYVFKDSKTVRVKKDKDNK